MKILGLRRDVVCGLAMVLALCAPRLVAQTRDAKPVPQQPRVPLTPPVVIPPRDRPPEARVGTGSIAGRVIDGTTGRPLARARVRLTSGGQPARGPVLTDADGAFVFTGVAVGSYRLAAERNGYLPQPFPETRSMRTQGQSLTIAQGQTRDDVEIAMYRGASISGRVMDAYGEAMDGASVMVQSATRGGRGFGGQSQTNDLGEFRVSRLPGGRYVLSVRALTGFQNDPGDQVVPMSLPTYHPGTLSRDQAQVISIARGQAISGLELTMIEGVPTVVNGLVVVSNGGAIGGGNVMARKLREFGAPDANSSIRPDGSFRILLPPGEFILEARAWPGSINQSLPPNLRTENQLFGTTRISVTGAGQGSAAILVGGGATASGRVVFEGNAAPPKSPGRAGVPVYGSDGQWCQAGQATIGDDWTFKAEGLIGTCGAMPRAMFGAWTLKAVMFRGRNLMDEPFTFEPGQHYGDVQIVVTDKRNEILLRVSDDAGQVTREFVAIAFSTDKSKWTQFQRYIHTFATTAPAPPAANRPNSPPVGPAGLPRMTGLPAGEYYIIAVDDIAYDDATDPVILEKLALIASRIVVNDEGPVEANLQRQALADVVR